MVPTHNNQRKMRVAVTLVHPRELGTNQATAAESAYADSCAVAGTGGHGFGYLNAKTYYGKCTTGESTIGSCPGEPQKGRYRVSGN